ncbi:MAG: T9SS type A sorting domain-containing protein [Gemmatimonadota bacterium]|nr:MAG: T9SS type A sorting domain-containing protein [Gemmatimonadota bacterium]
MSLSTDIPTRGHQRLAAILLLYILISCPVSARDFTIIGLPDTQYYTGNLFGGNPDIFQAQTRWIVDHVDSLNIVLVAHLGDVVEFGFRSTEWRRADEAMRILENPHTTGLADGIPYGIAVGNHDQPFKLYNQYFGTGRFSGRHYYGGHFGYDNNNHFALFSVSGLSFIVIFFEYTITSGSPVLSWADSLLNTYSVRRALVVHHSAAIGEGHPPTEKGEIIYEALKHHSNFFLMLCGHWGTEEWRGQETYDGNTVYSLVSDYQGRRNGGDGWLRIMEFSPDNNEIRVKTYSPTLNEFETDENSQFSLYYDMGSPTGVTEIPTAPCGFAIYQNYPNPFNSTTNITFQIGERRFPVHASLRVFNILGQEVLTLLDEEKESGMYTVAWDGKNQAGLEVASGIYFCRFSVDRDPRTEDIKIVVMR